MDKNLTSVSKHISKLLRHDHEDLIMSEDGYVSVDSLLTKLSINIETLDTIINENNKQRFSYNSDKTQVRANQGHTLNVVIDFEKVTSGTIDLYHGTSKSYLESIKKSGLLPMKRKYVHMSGTIETAKQVGLRHAKNLDDLLILHTTSGKLILEGIDVFVSENSFLKNGVYQVKQIPFEYLTIKSV